MVISPPLPRAGGGRTRGPQVGWDRNMPGQTLPDGSTRGRRAVLPQHSLPPPYTTTMDLWRLATRFLRTHCSADYHRVGAARPIVFIIHSISYAVLFTLYNMLCNCMLCFPPFMLCYSFYMLFYAIHSM